MVVSEEKGKALRNIYDTLQDLVTNLIRVSREEE